MLSRLFVCCVSCFVVVDVLVDVVGLLWMLRVYFFGLACLIFVFVSFVIVAVFAFVVAGRFVSV